MKPSGLPCRPEASSPSSAYHPDALRRASSCKFLWKLLNTPVSQLCGQHLLPFAFGFADGEEPPRGQHCSNASTCSFVPLHKRRGLIIIIAARVHARARARRGEGNFPGTPPPPQKKRSLTGAGAGRVPGSPGGRRLPKVAAGCRRAGLAARGARLADCAPVKGSEATRAERTAFPVLRSLVLSLSLSFLMPFVAGPGAADGPTAFSSACSTASSRTARLRPSTRLPTASFPSPSRPPVPQDPARHPGAARERRVRGAPLGDVIERAKPQWVEGDHAALRLRGNEIRRGKMWFQDGTRSSSTPSALRLHGLLARRAPGHVGHQPGARAREPFHDYNETLASMRPSLVRNGANHVIVTHYADASKGIGLHSDKTKSLGDDSLITVIKTGKASRPWVITNLDETVEIFNERLPPGDAVLMTTGANKLYKHGVPEVLADNNVVGKRKRKYADVEPTGSIVLRTVTDAITVEELDKRIAQLDRGREREKQKLQREHEERRSRPRSRPPSASSARTR